MAAMAATKKGRKDVVLYIIFCTRILHHREFFKRLVDLQLLITRYANGGWENVHEKYHANASSYCKQQ